MVAALLVVLTLTVIQVASFIHVRNTLIDAASTGARFGVLHDRTAEDGVSRTRDLIASSIAADHAQDVTFEHFDAVDGLLERVVSGRARAPVSSPRGGAAVLERIPA